MMISIILFIFLLDQATKLWVQHTFLPYQMVPIGPHFNLTLVYNKGVSFSLFSGTSFIHQLALVFISCVICFLLARWARHEQSLSQRGAAALIIGGALGNITDRLCLGQVVDFLDFYAYSYHWPAFNIADSAISIGVVILLINSLKKEQKKCVK